MSEAHSVDTAPMDRRILGWGKLYFKETFDWYIVQWDGSCFRTDCDDWLEVTAWLPLPAPLGWSA